MFTIDKVLWKYAGVQMGHSYYMPAAAECGGTMTYRYDQQNGAEGVLFMKAAYDSGADVLAGFGSCYNGIGMSAEMMLIQSAWLETVKYLEKGIDFDSVQFGLENIKRTGSGGNFLTDDLTLMNLRSDEFFRNDLFDLSAGESESRSMLERAHEKVEELVSDDEPSLPGDVQENLKRYFHDKFKNWSS